MQNRRRFLGGLTPDQFLARHWQKVPLLVRNALPDYVSPVEPEELAGLACEEEVEARVVTFDGSTWTLENGPFRPESFPQRGTRNWTLLVQDLDEHLPEVAGLLNHLDFLPTWRVDDVMASFAVPGGSVGPHFDEYDVFLLQVSGRRRWQITTRYSRTELRTDSNLRLLERFTPEQEWVVEPGDLLYLPPHVAHYGVAETNCVTFSLGCRAPSHADLVAQMAGLVLSGLDEDKRYSDADLSTKEAKRGVSPHAVQRTLAVMNDVWQVSPELAARCLGAVSTMPKLLFRQEVESLAPGAVTRKFHAKRGLYRRKGSRWTWYGGARAFLFLDGREYPASFRAAKEVLSELCSRRHFSAEWLAGLEPKAVDFVRELIRDGHLVSRP